jgi:hypothetical protein
MRFLVGAGAFKKSAAGSFECSGAWGGKMVAQLPNALVGNHIRSKKTATTMLMM